MSVLVRALFVDPNFVMRRTVAGAARDLQLAQVDEAASVEAGGLLLREGRYDVVLVDIDIDGGGKALGWIDEIRRGGRVATIVAMSASPNAALVASLRDRGVTQLLCKPFKIKDLLRRLPQAGVSSIA